MKLKMIQDLIKYWLLSTLYFLIGNTDRGWDYAQEYFYIKQIILNGKDIRHNSN